MKRNLLALVLLTSFMLLLSFSSVFALSGNVEVKISDASHNVVNKVFYGETSYLEFWLTNDVEIGGMTLPFRVDYCVTGTTWPTPYGDMPATGTKKILQYGTAIGAFDFGYLKFTDKRTGPSPDTFMIGGVANAVPDGIPLPIHATSTLCYDVKFVTPAGTDSIPACFCVDNIMLPPAGTWTMTDQNGAGGFAPDFMGNHNTSESLPDAPAVCFDAVPKPIPPCAPPTWTTTPAAAVSHSHGSAYTFTFLADPGGAAPVAYSTTVGSMVGGALTVPPNSQCGTTDVVVTATNSCQPPKSIDWAFTITWTNNDPYFTDCPAPTFEANVAMGNTFTTTLHASDPDPLDSKIWSIANTGVEIPSLPGEPTISNGTITFNTTNADGNKHFVFTVTVADQCGGTATCVVKVFVMSTQPFVIQIEKTHNSYQGHYETVSITKVAGSEKMGGFDFLIAYDASALIFYSAQIGTALGPSGCGWEYFTYRFGANGNCSGPCPSGLLRLIAIADINNGANHPSCYGTNGELASLKFYVTTDRTYECMKVDVRFAWFDCGDNAISSVTGDTLFISKKVFEFENTDPINDPLYDITGIDCGFAGLRYGGACSECDVSLKTVPIRFIYFWNGGVDIPCSDSIDARGDINLNGIANEIADAVMYTNYFLYGITAIPCQPITCREGAIAASDVNADGRTLTVGDLVYLLRVIVGDALPYPKLAPFANTANINVVNGVVSTEASTEIGAVYATFAVNGAYTVVNNSTMEVVSAENNGELKVLVYSGMNNMTNRIAAGSNNLFAVNGNVELKNVEVADYNGNMLTTNVNKTALPTAFTLSQNVPNPFNPTTKIRLSLPTVSDWSVDIYNVAGQLVKSFNGRGIGDVTVDWNASSVASGIYFYKATAGSFTDTKKMVLMK